jgi:NADH-quinone oxidoreductase subunit J
MENAIFLVFSLLAIGSAAGVVLNTKSTINSALCLVVSMLSLAVLFVMLRAEFVGVLQVMVYAGAIVVLFLFVIMLLNLEDGEMGPLGQPVLKTIGGVVILGATIKLGMLLRAGPRMTPEVSETFGQVREIGLVLFTDYLLAFEVTGILLLAGIVAAVMLAKKTVD